jgi:hypothetical protein
LFLLEEGILERYYQQNMNIIVTALPNVTTLTSPMIKLAIAKNQQPKNNHYMAMEDATGWKIATEIRHKSVLHYSSGILKQTKILAVQLQFIKQIMPIKNCHQIKPFFIFALSLQVYPRPY